MMRNALLAALMVWWLGTGGRAAASERPVLFVDDFTTVRERYEIDRPGWQLGNGGCAFRAPYESNVLVNLGVLDNVRAEADVSLQPHSGGGFLVAGLTLLADPQNHWRLLLVSSPEHQTYFELIERCNGVHAAQRAGVPDTALAAQVDDRALRGWQPGHTYHLTLDLTRDAIAGEVRDPSTGAAWRCRYAFGAASAARQGRVGLVAANAQGAFHALRVSGAGMAPSALHLTPGKRGTIAIVRDADNRVAAALQPMLTECGYGVTLLGWDTVAAARLSPADLDLLILADARRAPAEAIPSLVAFLQGRGKLLALGAPALGELLLRTPRGFVPAEKYAEAIYGDLARQPLPLQSKRWKHQAHNPQRISRLQELPRQSSAGGPGWKVTCEVDGWDTYAHDLDHGFPAGHELLCFQAQGDKSTPQLSIEIREGDGSRWIAAVELAETPRKYVLTPGDFQHWPDAGKSRRGGSGDRLHPQAAAALVIGLSHSHTPRCESGTHTYWIAGLATAPAGSLAASVGPPPELPALCPSHQLYPLDETVTLQGAFPGIEAGEEAGTWHGYCPVPREEGHGFDRRRPWRFVPLVEARDAQGIGRGAVAWMMIGRATFPGAVWAGVGLADPAAIAGDDPLGLFFRRAVGAIVDVLVRGQFLLEAGTPSFSVCAEEDGEVGAWVLNAGRTPQTFAVAAEVKSALGKSLAEPRWKLTLAPGEAGRVREEWNLPDRPAAYPCQVSATLAVEGGPVVDRLAHAVDQLPDRVVWPHEFVYVDEPNFKLDKRPWFLCGMNYWPNCQGGRNSTDRFSRGMYDPALVERDLAWMEAQGINLLTGIQAPNPPDPDNPEAYRDLHDFLERCRRHKMRVYYFLHDANPLSGGSFQAIQRHIEAAMIKNSPTILAWELSWEPIYDPTRPGRDMAALVQPWNRWIRQRYGSLDAAESDWQFKLPRTNNPRAGQAEVVALPELKWAETHGPWDRATAAFRRFFSDHMSQAYGDLIRQLRAYDPYHLITFRFGACGIPSGRRFAHAHSAGVAKHVDFLCPEGYNLQPQGPARPAPADALRSGGLVTLYYRFLSREKPVVWMEFGYSVNGMHTPWHTGREHVGAGELQNQQEAFTSFYRMFLESGARGAAPWWLPGGFRLGENSDFGVLEPDGRQRPACRVLRESLPQFAAVGDATCVLPANPRDRDPHRPVLELDLDAHAADAWETYAPQYLDALRSGKLPYLATRGTNTTSANCPLLAVGNTPCNGHNPPQFLNAEFNSVEIREAQATPYRSVGRDDVITVKRGAQAACRVTLGNLGEARWLAQGNAAQALGCVYLTCAAQPQGTTRVFPLPADTRYLDDAEFDAFELPLGSAEQQSIRLQLAVDRETPDGKRTTLRFGEPRTIYVRLLP